MLKTELYISTNCPSCNNGVGKVIPAPPSDYHSEAYSQYMQESHPAQPCKACKGKGSFPRVNPAWLREARVEAGLSRKDFAAHSGIGYGYISNVENGYAACTQAILEHYAALKPVSD